MYKKTLSPITLALYYFSKKQGELPKDWSPWMMNRFYSFHPLQEVRETTYMMNNLCHGTDKEFIRISLLSLIPKQFKMPYLQYIKKPKEKAQDIKPIIDMIQKKFNWTQTELDSNLPIIIEQFKDKSLLKEFAKKTGDSKLLRKVLSKKERGELFTPKPIQKSVTTLGQWC